MVCTSHWWRCRELNPGPKISLKNVYNYSWTCIVGLKYKSSTKSTLNVAFDFRLSWQASGKLILLVTLRSFSRCQRGSDFSEMGKGLSSESKFHCWSVLNICLFVSKSCAKFVHAVCMCVCADGSAGRQRDPRIAIFEGTIFVESLTSPLLQDTIFSVCIKKIDVVM